jgi:alkyldihydroxyacetonephosphate synthase
VSGFDSYEDPPDHQVAGFVAKLRSGDTLSVRPGPRRAVGPDLYALFHGMNGKVGDIRDAFVRVHRNGLEARPLPAAIDRNPPVGRAEGEWIDRVAEAASAARFPD